MKNKFDAKLRASFEAANTDRNGIENFKKLAKRDPAGAAAAVSKGIPLSMQRIRAQAIESYGVDIAREGWKEQFKRKQHSDIEGGLLLLAANHHLVLSRCQTELDTYTADVTLSMKERVEKVCEVGVEALRGIQQALLHNLQELQYQTSGEAEKFVEDELALRLAGFLATRISVRKNKRLAKALNGIRDHKKPASRERFEALCRELYAYSPESWSEHHVTDWQLETTRKAVLQKIEQPQTPHLEEAELAKFAHAEREALLKRGRDAGLPPSEYELLKLLAANPDIRNREAADRLGKSVGTVKKLKHNIKKTLEAA